MSIKHLRWQRPLLGSLVALSLLAGCDDGDGKNGDDTDAGEMDGGADASEPDGSDEQDADIDSGAPDAEVDGSEPDAEIPPAVIGQAEPKVLSLAEGVDRLCDATYDAQGNLYAVGYRAVAGDPTDREMIVAKFLPTGELDTNFGTQGVASKNVSEGGNGSTSNDCQVGQGGEGARAIVIHKERILIAGIAETYPEATDVTKADNDIVLVRFTMAGELDTAWATQGVRRFTELTHGVQTGTVEAPTWSGSARVWSLSVTSDDKFVIHGASRGDDARTDLDFTLLRVLEDGALDPSFSEDGIFTLDVASVNNSARSAAVLADGSIVGAGYSTATIAGTANQQQPVLYKVTSAGEPDSTFATGDMEADGLGDQDTTPGVYFGYVVGTPSRAEAYAAALQRDKFVTMGYGRNGAATTTDVVSFRFTADGKLDRSYGTTGAAWIDVGGFGDNGRAMLVLPDQRVLGIGGGRPTADNIDALLTLFTKDGVADTSFGEKGLRTYDLGGASDWFYGATVSPDQKTLAVVGYTGPGNDDADSALLLLPLD